ncbi:MAG TPA: bifunctional ornithine acetyltransferase/N-acetylglutamate synthase, partial [Polyangiaceae bacterium]|nr:bifunctional ornithine acetyltransferase/N-acetylglutamate synthase [Polyangiaceae bacterium]
ANGMSGAPLVDSLDGDAGQHLAQAILEVAVELAKAVARDGEGARKLVASTVRGAGDDRTARALARAVVESSLVKAALFGADPNPGRVLAALGACAARDDLELDPDAIDVSIQGVPVVRGGAPLELDADAIRAKLRHDEVTIVSTVGRGPASATAWGCDLSYDYVRINADYAAVVVDGPGGPVRRDGRLDVKTPELKTEVLVAALRYIERFAGTRAVIRYGATTTERRDLALRLAEDVRLLSAVGLTPILVQEGKSELVVTSLARAGVRAVGLSGADGNLLRLVKSDAGAKGRGDARPTLASEPPPPPDGGPRPWRVDPDVVETLLAKGYVPVVVPEITEELEGRAEPVDVDAVAAEIAVACGAKKLIQMCDAAGIVADGLLVSELSAEELADRVAHGRVPSATASRAAAAVRALAGGVDTVHMIDERVPHNVVAELFTESGVGTMVR